ncbi:MAG: helix-turn-helix domain-containing protein [Lachnospiraceae bacterium]|nr:helix-turn-helix domain-containing protein [Lachnospiraceae bacterium]
MLVDKNMTQTDLQRAIKCSSNTISKIKRKLLNVCIMG